ncbi:MAG: hypothetical protein HYV07_13400 [Deltaproteobacteria bacterium]|nr:hypothetical protein [Deltaproteobacteria bacterium]
MEKKRPTNLLPEWLTTLPFVLAACATAPSKNDSATPLSTEYAPLNPGANWTYEVKFLGQEGQMKVTQVEEDADGFVLDDRNGSWKHTAAGLRDKQRFLLMHPLAPGHTWSARVGPTVKETFVIESVGESCTVPAGTFANCLVVKSSIAEPKVTLHVRWIWAKGIGLAAFETSIEQTGGAIVPQTTQRLIHYALKGPIPKSRPLPPPPPEAAPEPEPPENWESE